MNATTLSRQERDVLFAAHAALANLHGKVTEVTVAQHSRNESAEKVLDAQLAISDAMLAISKALVG